MNERGAGIYLQHFEGLGRGITNILNPKKTTLTYVYLHTYCTYEIAISLLSNAGLPLRRPRRGPPLRLQLGGGRQGDQEVPLDPGGGGSLQKRAKLRATSLAVRGLGLFMGKLWKQEVCQNVK